MLSVQQPTNAYNCLYISRKTAQNFVDPLEKILNVFMPIILLKGSFFFQLLNFRFLGLNEF